MSSQESRGFSHERFNTVEIEEQDREYIIEAVTRQSNYSESPCSHICIKCRDGGQGYIKR